MRSATILRRLNAQRHAFAALNLRHYATDRKWSTPLAKTLGEAITTTGPVPVASYMRQCLTSDLGGYYTPKKHDPDRDQFGTKGDFVTSPEISQIFGELIGLWVVAEWMAQGQRTSGVCLMEMGPGRGTLMDDMLRTIRNFGAFASAIETVHLVEASPSLRLAQHKLLCGDHPLEETSDGHQSRSKHLEHVSIKWSEDLRLIPRDTSKSPFIIAHEFFDALPIHIFQSVPPSPAGTSQKAESKVNQWREMLVAPARPDATADFELTMARASTAHSLYLPEQSTRYQALKSTTDAVIEISPESQVFAADFANRIGSEKSGGAALIIDYGSPATVPCNSLRGIKAHGRVSPFLKAGRVDVSADVDFLALAEAALKASSGVQVHGPVIQAVFLEAMGIRERAAQLVKTELGRKEGLAELAKRVESGWRRLVDCGPQGMGRLYHVMAIVPHVPGPVRRPVGFGGDVKSA